MRGRQPRAGPLQPQRLAPRLGRAQVQRHHQPDLRRLPQPGGLPLGPGPRAPGLAARRRAGTEGRLPQVYHLPYYEACVRDACGCDSGGDCECLCDAVAAYAQACLGRGVCVDWRTPDFCREYLPLPTRGRPGPRTPHRRGGSRAVPHREAAQRDPGLPGPGSGALASTAEGLPRRARGRLTGTRPASRLLRLLQHPRAGGRRPVPVHGGQLHVALPAVPLSPEAAQLPRHQHRRYGHGAGAVSPEDGRLPGPGGCGGA